MTFLKFTLILLINAQTAIGEVIYCPPDAFQMPNENVCAFAISKVEYYHDVVKQCMTRGGIVAKIQNVFENAYFYALIEDVFDNQSPYIGVERRQDGNWTYSDGTPLIYRHWAPGEPRSANAGNICAVMNSSTGEWMSAECSAPRPYFCSLLGNDGPCPYNWIYFPVTKSCYYIQNPIYDGRIQQWKSFNFNESEAECNKMAPNSHLVSIHSKTEDNFIHDLVGTNADGSGSKVLTYLTYNNADYCWLGYTYIGLHGTGAINNGFWADGSPVDYTSVSSPQTQYLSWRMTNDPSCSSSGWMPANGNWDSVRFVCKMPEKKIFTN